MLSDLKLPMTIKEIAKCIPHRYPFLLIDRITEIAPDKYVKALKNVSMTDPHLQGHFPGDPVFPGVLIVEGVAQAAAVFGVVCSENKVTSFLLVEISASRFRRPVIPGDTMVYDVKLAKQRGLFYWFDAVVTVEGQTAAEVSFSARLQ